MNVKAMPVISEIKLVTSLKQTSLKQTIFLSMEQFVGNVSAYVHFLLHANIRSLHDAISAL